MTVPDPITRSPDHRISRSPDGSMFWRLWWRALSVKRSQAALALGSLVVGATITSMLLNLYGDVRRKMTEDFRAYGANVVIAPRSSAIAGSGQENSVVDEAALQPLGHFVHQTPGTSFAPVLYGVVRVSPDPADPRLPEFTNVVATGANFGTLSGLNPGWSATGQAVPGDLPPGTCALGANLAARLHVHPGDSLRMHRLAEADEGAISRFAGFRTATVVTTGASEDDQVFLPLGVLQSFLRLPGKVTLVEVSLPGGTRDVESAVHRLAGLLPGLEVRPIRQIVYSEGKVLGTIRWLLLSLTALILVIIALCVMATMTAIVIERRKDIGVMKALGAADALLMRLFMTEGASLGLVGGILGYGLGAIVARGLAERLFGVALSLNAWTLPAVCGLTVALALFAAQVPVRVLRAIQPTVVLKGE
jgi:putative ABC transport system permease protein